MCSHWHVGMSIDDPNVVRELEALGVRSGSRQVHEVPPDLRRALGALIGAAGDTRFGIVVDDPDIVRALAALRGPVEPRHVYAVGPPIRQPQQVAAPARTPRRALPSDGQPVALFVAADRRQRARGVMERWRPPEQPWSPQTVKGWAAPRFRCARSLYFTWIRSTSRSPPRRLPVCLSFPA